MKLQNKLIEVLTATDKKPQNSISSLSLPPAMHHVKKYGKCVHIIVTFS